MSCTHRAGKKAPYRRPRWLSRNSASEKTAAERSRRSRRSVQTIATFGFVSTNVLLVRRSRAGSCFSARRVEAAPDGESQRSWLHGRPRSHTPESGWLCPVVQRSLCADSLVLSGRPKLRRHCPDPRPHFNAPSSCFKITTSGISARTVGNAGMTTERTSPMSAPRSVGKGFISSIRSKA